MSEHPTKASFSAVDYVVFIASLVVSLGIGVYQGIRGRGKSTTDFLMAEMSPVPVALSLVVGIVSAVSILGNSSEMYFYGSQLWTNIIGMVLGGIIVCRFIVPILYPLKLITMYEYLGLRWETDVVRKATTVMQMFNNVIFLGIALYAPSLALSSVTPIPTSLSIALLGAVCTIYSTLGGSKAVVYTDTFQSVVMLAGVVAVIAQGCIDVGGGAEVWKRDMEHGRIEFFNMDPNPLVRHTFWTTSIFGIFFGLQLYGSSQAQFQRWGSVATLKQAYLVMAIAVGGLAFAWSLINFSGLVVFAVYADCDPYELGLIDLPDQITAYFVVDKLGYLVGVPGLFVAAVYSGVLSSVSSILNSLSAIVWEDLMKPLAVFAKVPPSRALSITKCISLVMGTIAIGLGYLSSSLGGLVQAAYSISSAFGGPITGLFLAAVFCPWVSAVGAMSGATVSLILNMWMVTGAFLYAPPPDMLPRSTDGCNNSAIPLPAITSPFDSTASPALSLHGTSSIDFLAGAEDNEATDDVFPLYLLSYCYILPIGSLTTVLVSSVVSLILGRTLPEDVPKHLVNESCLRLYRWLSPSHQESKENNTKSTPSEIKNNQKIPLDRINSCTGKINISFIEDEIKGNID